MSHSKKMELLGEGHLFTIQSQSPPFCPCTCTTGDHKYRKNLFQFHSVPFKKRALSVESPGWSQTQHLTSSHMLELEECITTHPVASWLSKWPVRNLYWKSLGTEEVYNKSTSWKSSGLDQEGPVCCPLWTLRNGMT